VPWFVLQTTGSATGSGIVAFAAIVPVVIAGVFGGAMVDRLGYRRTSIVADLTSGATVALIPLLFALDRLPFGLLLALVGLGALLDAPGGTARSAMLPDLAATGGVGIERATASAQVVERGTRLVGAPLAGALIALLGPTAVLWLDAATFAVSAMLIGFIVPAARRAASDNTASEGYLASLLVGLRFIRGNRLILAVVLTVAATNCLDAAWFSIVAPVSARDFYGGAAALGLLLGATGGGAVVGTIVYGAFGHRVRRRSVFVACFVLVATVRLPLAAMPSLPVAVALYAVLGLAAGPLNPILGAGRYERIPAELRGPVLRGDAARGAGRRPVG